MSNDPRIRLDASKLLGFKQLKGAAPGDLAGQQAKVGGIPAVPEPSTWVQLLVGLLMLGVFALRSRYRRNRVQPVAIAAAPVVADATPDCLDK